MATGIADLPIELAERILFYLDPRDISQAAKSGRVFRNVVYGVHKQSFWRVLYLIQPLDDPRHTVTHLCSPRACVADPGRLTSPTSSVEKCMVKAYRIDWCKDLQQILHAAAVARNIGLCRKGELAEVLQTLLDVATNLPSVPFDGARESHNIVWLVDLLGDGAFLDTLERMPPWQLTLEERQLLAKLHVWIGLTPKDTEDMEKRTAMRALVYNLRNYTLSNAYGPFFKDGSMRVDWVAVQALAHVYEMLQADISSHASDSDTEDDGDSDDDNDLDGGGGERKPDAWAFATGARLPLCQSVIPPGTDLAQTDSDWAGVEGLWSIGYCIIDEEEFTAYNTDPESNISVLEDNQIEDHHAVRVCFRITSFKPNPDHPCRPEINYTGDALNGDLIVTGFVRLTPDNQVRWHFGCENADLGEWSCEGVGLGSIRSPLGIVGVWSTLRHGAEDPAGPFWMHRRFCDKEV